MKYLTKKRQSLINTTNTVLDGINKKMYEDGETFIYSMDFDPDHGLKMMRFEYVIGEDVTDDMERKIMEHTDVTDVDRSASDTAYPVLTTEYRMGRGFEIIAEKLHSYSMINEENIWVLSKLKSICGYCRRKRIHYSCDEHEFMRTYFHSNGARKRSLFIRVSAQ